MAYKVEKNGRIQWRGRIKKNGKVKQRNFDSKKEALDWEAETRNKDWSTTDTVFSMGEWAQQRVPVLQAPILFCQTLDFIGDPRGNRTPVTGVRGRRPNR